jgi:hypothetical protein
VQLHRLRLEKLRAGAEKNRVIAPADEVRAGLSAFGCQLSASGRSGFPLRDRVVAERRLPIALYTSPDDPIKMLS